MCSRASFFASAEKVISEKPQNFQNVKFCKIFKIFNFWGMQTHVFDFKFMFLCTIDVIMPFSMIHIPKKNIRKC